MRPVRLEAEGFTCYRERQDPLDFSQLSLFAIAGPTGAGKSSILDTILYALYGEVPRIGKQGIGEFIAHGRDAMSVVLDFSVRGATYRVARRVKRAKKGLNTNVTLAELVAGDERSVADGVKPVNEAIERLLGLDFAAFTQTVILPQNEFSKFLKSAPGDQRGILQNLLRHEIFERMRVEAERRRAALEGETRAVERQLGGFDDATPEALASRQAALSAARATARDLAVRKLSEDTDLQEQRERHRLTAEAQRLRGSRAGLEQAAAAVSGKRDELEAARRAAEIAPRLEACVAADARLSEASLEVTAAAKALLDRTVASDEAERRLLVASANAQPLSELNARIRALDEIKGDLARRDALRMELDTLGRGLPSARTRTTNAEQLARDSRSQDEAAAATLDRAHEALAATGFDAGDQQRLDELWTTVVRLRAADEELARLGAQQGALESAHERAGRALVERTHAFEAATAAADAARVAEHDAGAALEGGRVTHQVAAVREHLHAGDACPVCLQTVVLMPPAQAVPELAALTAARERARAELGVAQKVQQASAEARGSAQASVDAATHARDAALDLRQQKADARASLHASLTTALAGAVVVADESQLPAAVETRRSELRDAKLAHDRAVEQLRAAEVGASSASLAVVKAESELRAASEAQHRLESDQASRQSELDLLLARIAAVSGAEDPAAEREGLAQTVRALEAALRDAQAARAAVLAETASATARHSAATAGAAQAQVAAAAAGDSLDAAVREARFADINAVRSAIRPALVQRALDEAVRTHDSEYAGVLARLLELEPRIAGREVSGAALASAEAAYASTFEAWRQAELDAASLAAACERLATDVATRMALQQQLAAAREGLALHAGMASDLRGDAFQEYLLEEAFHSLVAGASVRMRQMSNRYTLDWKDSDFFVVDHDNAGERRRAETLSGGETFMASLCLALQLSDEVLKTSGALQMDSLFIDEGFGTLDAESLGEVTDAMEALRQDGARLIGVISHRPELTERLPGCIKVVKGSGESTWRLERVG